MSGLFDMKIAILITNTDFSEFAKARANDGEKFAALLAEVRPEWTCDLYWVCRDEFPSDLETYDGVLITGSPASVNDDMPWIAKLTEVVRNVLERNQPLFAACFGHQLVAKVLGANVVRNPLGWGHGLLSVERVHSAPWSGEEAGFALYGSHNEQVDALPEGATLLFHANGLAVGGFQWGDSVFTIQHHPEMTHEFITDLVEEYADYVGPEVTAAARASLENVADRQAFAMEIARFFEYAAKQYKVAE